MDIQLSNDQLTVTFRLRGGEMTSIKDASGLEYLWQGDPTYWSSSAPVLFPNCGSVRNDQAIFNLADGHQVTGNLPRHGLVRKQDFKILSQTEYTLIFSIDSTDEMYKNYPYRFRLDIRYTLIGKQIKVDYLIVNQEADQEMPYFLGGHPGFNCPLHPDENYSDYYLEFDNVETCDVPTAFPETGLIDRNERHPLLHEQSEFNLDYSYFEVDALILDKLKSRQASLKSRNHSQGVKVSFEGFPYLIVWSTPNQGPFIALEPWSGLSTSLEESDQFIEKRDVSFVKAGESDVKSFTIEIL